MFNNVEFKQMMNPFEVDSVLEDIAFKMVNKTLEMTQARHRLEKEREES